MQRLFSTFADGWPGAGLLLLRLSAGLTIIHSGIVYTEHGSLPVISAMEIVALAASPVLIVGFLTPVAGAVAATAKMWIGISEISSHMGDPCNALVQATLAAALAMIGPGAWSIDAHRFGRKRIDLSR